MKLTVYDEFGVPTVTHDEKYIIVKKEDVDKLEQLNAEMLEVLRRCNNYMIEKGISHEYAIMKEIKSIIEKNEAMK